jgi:hypothetical protein
LNGILSLKELKELLRNEKSLKIILIAGLFLIIIIAFSGFSTGKTEKNDKMFFDFSIESNYEIDYITDLLKSKVFYILVKSALFFPLK